MIKLFNTKEEAEKQLPLFSLRKFKAEGSDFSMVRTNSGIHVFGDSCPHEGCSLALGDVVGDSIVCPWHQFHFDLKSGKCTDNICGDLKLYDVLEKEDGLFISY